MVSAQPTIAASFVWAYWDLGRALRALWRPALAALAILSVGLLLAAVGPRVLTHDPLGQVVHRQVFEFGLCFLLTPFVMAVLRFVLVGEVAPRYALAPASPRFQLLFGWLAMMSLVANIPSFLLALTTPTGPIYYVGARLIEQSSPAIVVAARVAVLVLLQRLLVLLPAIAVDAPGRTWQNAFRDTQDHVWFVLVASGLPFVPFVLLGAAMAPVFHSAAGTQAGLTASVLWAAAVFVVLIALAAVIASRLYQLLGDKLNRAPPAAAQGGRYG
jgi:hypothetical protein